MSADDDITRQERPAEASVGGGLVLFTDLITLPSKAGIQSDQLGIMCEHHHETVWEAIVVRELPDQ